MIETRENGKKHYMGREIGQGSDNVIKRRQEVTSTIMSCRSWYTYYSDNNIWREI